MVINDQSWRPGVKNLKYIFYIRLKIETNDGGLQASGHMELR